MGVDMKKLAKTLLMTFLIAIIASSLWAAPTKETAVIRLTAYIPEKASVKIYDEGFFVESYAYKFSYSMHQGARTKIFSVMAT